MIHLKKPHLMKNDLMNKVKRRVAYAIRITQTAAIMAFSMIALSVSEANTAAAKPNVAHFTLDNGLEVVVIPDHRAPVVTHMVWYRVGAADEKPGKSGIAHFLEHLMFKGTNKIGPGEFSKIIARNGGQDNAFTNQDVTAYFQRVAKDRLPLVMEMEADRMANLKLAEKDVLTERDVILEERRSRVDNDPSSILQEQMLATLYLNHPYGIPTIGWAHEIKNLSRADALEHYKRYYGPNNAILVVAGDITPEEVRKLAEKTYGKVKRVPELKTRQRPQEPEPHAARRIVLKDPRAAQPTMQRYYLAPSYTSAQPGEAEALDLLMRVLAASTTSRIYKEVVVNKKKASSAGGWYSGTALDNGRLAVYAVSSGGEAEIAAAEQAIDEVIEDLKTHGITQKELDRAREAAIANRIYAEDSQSALARRYGWALTTGQTIKDVEEWPERLAKVTTEDIVKVARKYLVKKRSVTGILLPEKQIREASVAR